MLPASGSVVARPGAGVADHPAAAAAAGQEALDRLPAEPRPPGDKAGGRVYYHDPCHLTRGAGIFKEPRELLRKVPGTELMNPDPEGSNCCGFGGGVRLNHPTASIEASRKEHGQVASEGGDIIITNCAGCRQNLMEGRPENGPMVYDLAEYILLSLGEGLPRNDGALVDMINRAYARGVRGYSRP